MARLDSRAVRQSVLRLTEKYDLTPLARRQLRVFFEIIIAELSPDNENEVSAEVVERFMRRIADTTNLTAGRYVRDGRTLPSTSAVTASDLLHAWQNFREFNGGRSLLQGQPANPDEQQVAAILDKD